jgi:hypothetical protein
MKLKLSDQAIVRIVDLLQVAIITGTDVVDNFRTLTLVADGNELVIDPDDNAAFIESINNLALKASEIAKNGAYELT